MKTVKGLHEKMYTFDNANTSFKKAAANKRFHEEVLAFSMSKEDELFRACEELENLTYKQGNIPFSRYGSQRNALSWRCRSMTEWCST